MTDRLEAIAECAMFSRELPDEERLVVLPEPDFNWLIAEVKHLREKAIGGDGSTHWYYKDQVESLLRENEELRRERSQD